MARPGAGRQAAPPLRKAAVTPGLLLSSRMPVKISPSARGRLSELALLQEKVQRAHGLVEQYAAARANHEQFVHPVVRAFSQLKLHFMAAGLDTLSQLAGAMEVAARRGMSPLSKVRILRDGVGSMRFQVEMAQRAIMAEEAAKQEKQAAEAGPAGP
jgi:hypothetical protein